MADSHLARAFDWLWSTSPAPEVKDARTPLWVWAAVLAITLWASWQYLDGWGAWSLNGDEGIYYQMAVAPMDQAEAEISGNAHPPLYPYVLRAMAWVREDFDWLRVPALLAALLLIPVVFLLGRRLSGDGGGLVAAIVVAASPGLIWLAPIVRPYTIHALLLATALLLLWKYLESGRRLHLGLYVLSISGALLVHYATFVVLGAIGVFFLGCLIARRLSRRQVVDLVLAHLFIGGVGALLYVTHIAPRLQGSGMQEEARRGWLKNQFVGSADAAWLATGEFSRYAFGRLRVIVPLLIVAALYFAPRKGARGFVVLTVAAFAVALGFSALSQYPLGGSRHSIYLTVLFAPAAAACVGGLMQQRRRVFALVGLALFALFVVALVRHKTPASFERTVPMASVNTVWRHVDQMVAPEDLIIVDEQTHNLIWPFIEEPGPAQAIVDVPRARAIRSASGRNFIIFSVWILSGVPGDALAPGNLLHDLDTLDRAPDRWNPRGKRVWLVQGGWGPPISQRLPAMTADGTPVHGEVVGGAGLTVTQLYVDGYRKLMAE